MFLSANTPRLAQSQVVPNDITWTRDLSMDEIYAIAEYTQTGYRSLNTCLFEGTDLSESDKTLCQQLDGALAKAPKTPPQMLSRGQNGGEVPQVGDTYTFDAFASTTTDPARVGGYVERDSDRGLIFEIVTRKGVDVNAFSAKEGREREFLLPRGTSFIVADVFTSEWTVTETDEEAGVFYDYTHHRKVTVVQLIDPEILFPQQAAA